jgi:hypothetical protein
MNRWRYFLSGLVLWPAASLLAAPMTPGLWTMSMTIESGLPTQVTRPVTECITQQDIDSGNKVLPRPEGACTLSNVYRSDEGATYDLACMNGALQYQGRASLVISGDRYTGNVAMAVTEHGTKPKLIGMKIVAQRVGECSK